MKRTLIAAFAIGCATFIGCGSENVELVKDGSFPNDPTTTIGKILKGHPSLKNSDWESYEDFQGRPKVSVTLKRDISDTMKNPLNASQFDDKVLNYLWNGYNNSKSEKNKSKHKDSVKLSGIFNAYNKYVKDSSVAVKNYLSAFKSVKETEAKIDVAKKVSDERISQVYKSNLKWSEKNDKIQAIKKERDSKLESLRATEKRLENDLEQLYSSLKNPYKEKFFSVKDLKFKINFGILKTKQKNDYPDFSFSYGKDAIKFTCKENQEKQDFKIDDAWNLAEFSCKDKCGINAEKLYAHIQQKDEYAKSVLYGTKPFDDLIKDDGEIADAVEAIIRESQKSIADSVLENAKTEQKRQVREYFVADSIAQAAVNLTEEAESDNGI